MPKSPKPAPPKLTREQALELENSLIEEFQKERFQRDLHRAWNAAGGDEIKQFEARQAVCLPIQIPVVEKYGFEPSRQGVALSVRAFRPFDDELEFQVKGRVLSWLVTPTVQHANPVQPVPDLADFLRLRETGIGELPELVGKKALPEISHAIAAFAKKMQYTPSVHAISGGRMEVFLTGNGSATFQQFLRIHDKHGTMTDAIADLRTRLAAVARANGGELSDDTVALVGASEMQVPHVDLKPGQVQIIVALLDTVPTLVYRPDAPIPPKGEVAAAIGIDIEAKHQADSQLAPLLNGGAPLVLPVETLYERMVPACTSFQAGDALQMRDGIVHAGPKCEEVDMPRIVIFSTYTTTHVEHYNVGYQYKIWDWAYHSEVPAAIAHRRLKEVHKFSETKRLGICPWTHCHFQEASQACETLCKSKDLSEQSVQKLVQAWRGRKGVG